MAVLIAFTSAVNIFVFVFTSSNSGTVFVINIENMRIREYVTISMCMEILSFFLLSIDYMMQLSFRQRSGIGSNSSTGKLATACLSKFYGKLAVTAEKIRYCLLSYGYPQVFQRIK